MAKLREEEGGGLRVRFSAAGLWRSFHKCFSQKLSNRVCKKGGNGRCKPLIVGHTSIEACVNYEV